MQMTALVASSLMTLNVSGHISQLEMETLSHEETLIGKISQQKKEESPSKKNPNRQNTAFSVDRFPPPVSLVGVGTSEEPIKSSNFTTV
jgi:hypothetical protein